MLGNGTVDVTVKIVAWRQEILGVYTNKGFWSVYIEYNVRDSFTDPSDIWDTTEGAVDWLGCKPYDIVARWWTGNGGLVWESKK